MSFKFNSDREQIRAIAPSLIGDSELTIRSGIGSDEKEIFRAQLDPDTNLPRVGINRTGSRIDRIEIISQGSGYTVQPTVTLSAPPAGGIQARASAVISEGFVIGVLIDNPGSGYTSAPSVSITGGNGSGAQAQAFLDTVDFELDINGAIRTSTSIISDTARILNLDIDNFITADAKFRAPNFKTFVNNTGTPWSPNTIIQRNDYRYRGANVYQALNGGQTAATPPLHTDGIQLNGEVQFKHIGFRVTNQEAPYYDQTGESGLFPRSITPLLGDKSDKIATTEYVLNLATNDVGGRIYVSQQIGDNSNDGRSAVNPVRTIKRACQLAWETPGVKESIIVSGGDYVEDNPISIPPDASVVGDNLRLVIIRPANPRKHIFKFGDKNYVIGVTYRDFVDSSGDPVHTWDFAMVFDDKQRIEYDYSANGDFGTSFPVGHQIFGPERFRASYQSNTGLSNLSSGQQVKGVNTGALGTLLDVTFNRTTGPDAYISGTIDFKIDSGQFIAGETFLFGGTGTIRFEQNTEYTIGQLVWADDYVYQVAVAGTSGSQPPTHDTGTEPNGPDTLEFTYLRDAYEFISTDIRSIRAEGEVVFTDEDIESVLPISRIDFSKQGTDEVATGGFGDYGVPEDLGGIVFYTNALVGRQNVHNFKEGQEIVISGLPNAGPDLSFLNGKQRIYKVLEDADGRSRRFVIPKKTTVTTSDNFDPGQFATVSSYSKSITLSLLNSPNKFSMATPVARRYQDACLQIRNNIDFIADEVVRRINDEFKKEYFSAYEILGNDFKIYLGPSRFVHTYVSGGTVTFGGNTYNITNFQYDNVVTGEATITTDNPVASLTEDDIVQLAGIIVECDIDGVTTQKTYPSFNIPVSDQKCRRDIGYFLSALIRDLEFGSNYNIIEAGKKYIDGTNTQIEFVDNEIVQTVRAIEYARELAIYAMRKWRTGDGTPSDPIYVPQYSSVERYFDPTVIDDLASPACANVASAINTLSYLFVDVIANDASGTYLDGAYLIARNRDFIADEAYNSAITQFPSLGLDNIDERKCRRDINFIISGLLRDLILGGNFGIVTAAESYFTGAELTGIPSGELGATIYAFNEVRDLCILAMRNWETNGGNGPTYTPVYSPIPLFTDNTILTDPAGTPWCADFESSITTAFALLEDILDGTVAPGATTKETGTLFDTTTILSYPDSTIYDANGTILTPRSDYDDYPIIEASPYTQNASIISFRGGGGALIDGSKVKQPNCPFPGLQLDGSATFPNQGKSMVASAFTIVSFGGTGYKVINDGYTQLVSVFCIFCADGVLAENGGYASITNSATNFGIFALRGIGYNDFAYSFDIGQITNVSSTPTGRTIFTVNGLGREPLEHYVVKIDGFENVNPDIEYFIDAIEGVTVGPPFSAQITIESGSGGGAEFKNISTGSAVSVGSLVGETIRLHRPSIVNSSSHTWEYAGSGTNYNALPENGGVKVEANEQVSENYGRTYVSGTDELGDFKVGTFARIENRTGNITFTGTVTISEVEFLKLKGGDVVVTGFDNSNTLGGANSTDSKLPTQKAVRDYITNNLGPYLNKPYSTNPVPRALVELTDSGKISEDQIPPLRPFQVYTVANQAERTAIEGALAGDIAIQQDTSTSFILNNDNDSLFVAFNPDSTLQFTIGDVFTGDQTGGKIQATEYRQGVVYQINITDPGSGYVTPPVITISGGNPQAGAVAASATAQIANGQVVVVTIELFNGFVGGKGYTTAPTVTFAAPAGSGTQATGVALIESRLYGDIVNNVKIEDNDTIQSSDLPSETDLPPETISINRVVNTSASNTNNWVSLSTNQIAATDITSGVISTARLASNSSAANSFTFLRGDQSYALVVQSIKGAEKRYFAKLIQQANSGSSQLIFSSNSNTLYGHEVVANISGIQANTLINGVLTAEGQTTVSINNALTATIPVGTIIEFERGTSPLTFDSSFTQGDFIDQVVIGNGGTGFDDGQYFDVELTGGTGTGLRANLVVASGTVTEVILTSTGSGYENDFTVSSAPAEIGGGSGLVLLAKLSTVNKQFANVSLDIQRVSDLTISADEYGTIGVARFYKDQFLIGQAGNGSVQIKTGPDSGLDADLLDGAQGSFYLNAGNLNAGTLSVDRLSGTYNIGISGQSGNTLRLITSTNNPTSNPSPDAFSAGVIADTRNNAADGLADGGTRHLVMSIRQGGSGFDATFGGVRQLAFTDNDNMWLRGSRTSPANQFGTWGKIWSSLNDGVGSGLDADRLDNRQGSWYQNAINLNSGIISDERIPDHQTAKDFQDSVRVLDWSGQPRFKILVLDELLNTTPFLVGQTVNLYNANGQGTGVISITNVEINQDLGDIANNYTLITGTLTTGNFIGAIAIGTTAINYPFRDFSIADLDANADGLPDGTFEVGGIISSGGNARLLLGRNDGQSSDPSIYFRSSALKATDYNVALIASGGNATNGSGTLELKVANNDGVTILGNKIWNEGNITFNASNVVGSGVIRDASGNFSAGTITANLTGNASGNVLKGGDTMSGALTISNVAAGSQALSVSGRADFLSNITVAANLAVDTDTLFVDATKDAVGINVGTTLTTGIGLDILGGAIAALRLSGPANATGHQLLIDGSRNSYYDDSNHAMMFISSGAQNSTHPGEGAHWIFNGRADDRDFIFRNNFSNKLIIQGNGGVVISNSGTNNGLSVDNMIVGTKGLTLGTTANNDDAPLYFLGATGASDGAGAYLSNFRVGNGIIGGDIFEITPNNGASGPTTWKSTPALAIQGTNNRVAINTTLFGGTDPSDGTTQRVYTLNVGGDININGNVFQNNSEFVTSRWTESTNGLDIHRLSKVGINRSDPNYELDVSGDIGIEAGTLRANGDEQWLDTYGIFKSNRNIVDENITIPSNTNTMSSGPITINNGVTISIPAGSSWSVV